MGILWGKRIRLTFLVATTSTNTSGPGLAALHRKPRVANPPLTSDTPRAARVAMLLGVFVTSALCADFSRSLCRCPWFVRITSDFNTFVSLFLVQDFVSLFLVQDSVRWDCGL